MTSNVADRDDRVVAPCLDWKIMILLRGARHLHSGCEYATFSEDGPVIQGRWVVEGRLLTLHRKPTRQPSSLAHETVDLGFPPEADLAEVLVHPTVSSRWPVLLQRSPDPRGSPIGFFASTIRHHGSGRARVQDAV
jgi:hypothetical protein